jgi:molybdenum cofactor biosynthesis enzyme MoaA
MPPEGIRPIENRSILSYEEITRGVRISASLGVRKIRLLCDFVRIEVNRLISDIG